MSKLPPVPWKRTTPSTQPSTPPLTTPQLDPKDLWDVQYHQRLKRFAGARQRARLAAATRIAQSALVKLKPVIYNATAMRMEEGKQAVDNAALKKAVNALHATRGATAGISHLTQTRMTTPTEKMRHLQGLRLQNQVIKTKGGAQCGELSEYVFNQCYEEGLFPFHAILALQVELLGNPDDNHAYVAIGLENPGDHSDMATWPEDVVICDPWVMYLIRGTSLETGSNPGAYTAAQYMNLVKPYFKLKGAVHILYGHEQELGTSVKPVIGGARAPFGSQGIADRSSPQYQAGYKFGAEFKRGAYPAANSEPDWWKKLVAAKTRPVALKLVGVPNPPTWDDGQQALWELFRSGCEAGNA
jgi:hypothetical protein